MQMPEVLLAMRQASRLKRVQLLRVLERLLSSWG
jgi:hypothetical protein